MLIGCGNTIQQQASFLTGGDPHKGMNKMLYYGCPSCHTIPGVPGANGLVGPPLNRIASRVYLGGHLPNTPSNLTRWLQNPQEVDPHNAMPNMHITPGDARDIAAYLYTLR